jgi:hypothetical protein
MDRPEYPYRECIHCTGIEDCRNLDVDLSGKPVPPEDCIRRKEVEEEIQAHYELGTPPRPAATPPEGGGRH